MPRGVYTRKKAAKKSTRKAPAEKTTTRRRRRAADIPTISRSTLVSSVNAGRTPDHPDTVVTAITPAPVAMETASLVKSAYVVLNSDGDNIDGETYSTYEAAVNAAKSAVEEMINDSGVEIYQLVATLVGREPEEPKPQITVLRVEPKL